MLGSLLLGVAACTSKAEERAPDCIGTYQGSSVVDLCDSNWPDARAGRLWLVVFHAPWCGHCQELQPMYMRLARDISASHPGIGLGAIDCSRPPHHDVCRRNKIIGYPTMKAIVAGKVVASYEGAREAEALRRWLLDVFKRRGGSARCPKGLVNDESSLIPLCEAHFPRLDARNYWFLVYYDIQSPSDLLQPVSSVATEVGGLSSQPWQEQLREIGRRYSMRLSMPKGAHRQARGHLMKFGSICCDCERVGDVGALCGQGASRPMVAWFGRNGTVMGLLDSSLHAGAALASKRRILELALQALGARRQKQRKYQTADEL